MTRTIRTFLAATILAAAPALSLAEPHVVTVHDRAPHIHDRAPRPHDTHVAHPA